VPLPSDDHISIAKPARADALVYVTLKGLLKELQAEKTSGANPMSGGMAADDLVGRLSGDWWGRVTTPGHEAALSLTRIERHSRTGEAVIEGMSFDLKGEQIAEWWSRFSRVLRSQQANAIELEFLFEGRREKKDSHKPVVEGYARYEFSEPSNPRERVLRGDGRFFSVRLAADAETGPKEEGSGIVASRLQQMRRATQAADIQLARDGTTAQRKDVVGRILSSVWGL
jgi:hypothetical protein